MWLDASGNATFLRANSRRERHQRPLPWDPEMEEAAEQPPHLILLDPSFLVYRGRRRNRVSSST